MNEAVLNTVGAHGATQLPADRMASKPLFSIVIPMRDEAESVVPLLKECHAAAAQIGAFEICITDDGSRDGTADELRQFKSEHPDTPLTVVTHARSAGQSAAVYQAVRVARAEIVCTLDGDGQNPPDQIAGVLAPLLAPDAPLQRALVAGQRAKRNDPAAKRLASRAANALRAALLRDGTRDTGCGLKAFRRQAFLGLPYFNHMHRFLPALFQRDGWEVVHVDVDHRPRNAGQSKYNNLGRAIVGASDLIGVAWLIRRRLVLAPGDVSVSFYEQAEK